MWSVISACCSPATTCCRASPRRSWSRQGTSRTPLGNYAASLRKIAELEVDEILPAHEWRFAGLRERVHTILRHHDERLAEIEQAVTASPGITTWQVTERLPWSRPFQQLPDGPKRLAVREILAHLVVLAEQGRVRETGDPVAGWYPGPVPGSPVPVSQPIAATAASYGDVDALQEAVEAKEGARAFAEKRAPVWKGR